MELEKTIEYNCSNLSDGGKTKQWKCLLGVSEMHALTLPA